MTLQQLKYALAIADCNSINKAAQTLFLSQSSLSGSIKELEREIGFAIFVRTNRSITVTPEGKEFLGYARQVTEQYQLIEDKYIDKKNLKEKFSVTTQHYSFAVKAFVEMVKEFGMKSYEFAIFEAKTHEVIEDVSTGKSELGILYLNNFNRKVLTKIFKENKVEFIPLFTCKTFVYLWDEHPLAHKKEIAFEELADYPCLSFNQGNNNSFYFAEEVLSTLSYDKIVKVNDRATVLNLMVGLNGYTLCSGIISEELNGTDFKAIPFKSDETMEIGYIKRIHSTLTPIAEQYIAEMLKQKHHSLSV